MIRGTRPSAAMPFGFAFIWFPEGKIEIERNVRLIFGRLF